MVLSVQLLMPHILASRRLCIPWCVHINASPCVVVCLLPSPGNRTVRRWTWDGNCDLPEWCGLCFCGLGNCHISRYFEVQNYALKSSSGLVSSLICKRITNVHVACGVLSSPACRPLLCDCYSVITSLLWCVRRMCCCVLSSMLQLFLVLSAILATFESCCNTAAMGRLSFSNLCDQWHCDIKHLGLMSCWFYLPSSCLVYVAHCITDMREQFEFGRGQQLEKSQHRKFLTLARRVVETFTADDEIQIVEVRRGKVCLVVCSFTRGEHHNFSWIALLKTRRSVCESQKTEGILLGCSYDNVEYVNDWRLWREKWNWNFPNCTGPNFAL